MTLSDLEKFFFGVEFQTIESIERFYHQLPQVLGDEFKETEKDLATAYVLLRICEALDVNVEDIMERVPNDKSKKTDKES